VVGAVRLVAFELLLPPTRFSTRFVGASERHGKRELLPMRWGIVASWWSKPLKEMKLVETLPSAGLRF
jgi:putative SOS response-associated peptidase YedK